MYTVRIFLSIACVASSVVSQAREIQWTYDPPLGNVDSSPGVADMNGDGKDDLILTTTAGITIMLDHEGHQVWMSGVQIPISTSPTIVNLVEDPTPEVLVVNQSGRVYCLSGKSGDTIWQYDLPGKIPWGTTAIAAHDLDGDDIPEIITSDDSGHVVCLSHEGELLWQYDGAHGVSYCPAVGTVGGDKAPAILISGNKQPLICLNADGTLRWRVKQSGDGASPVIADVDGDGKNEIVTALNNAVMLVDGNGKVRWTYKTPKHIDSSLIVADADEDGEAEVYAIDLSGTVVSLAADGSKRWSANVRERVRRSPAVVDVNGDGEIEVVIAGYSGEMYLFSGDGELKETLPMVHNTNGAPTVADLNGDGTPYIVYVTGAGNILAYKWPEAKPDTKVLWGEYRFSSARQGSYQAGQHRSAVRIKSIDFGQYYAGANSFSIEIDNPDAVELKLEVSIEQSGKKTRLRTYTTSDEQVDHTLKYPISSAAPVSVSVDVRIYSGEHLVAQRTSNAYIVPFQKELADLTALIHAVQTNAQQLPKAYALLGEAAQAQSRMSQYSERVAIAGTLSDVARRELRDTLREELNRFNELSVLTKAAVEHYAKNTGSIQLSAANPWAPFGGLQEVVEGRMNHATLNVNAFHGETESVAINMANWGTGAQTLRVEIDPLSRDNGEKATNVSSEDAVDILEVLNVPTQTLDLSADALPRINTARALTLPAWDMRQLWLNIDTSTLAPGVWHTTVHLRSLEVESQTYSIPLTVTVWKTKQADINVLKHCNWGYVHNSRLKEHEDQSIAERVAHGNNVFVSLFTPQAKYDEAGNIIGEIDFTKHDVFIKKYASNGMILFHNLGGLTGPGGLGSEAYQKAYIPWMREWVKHLKELGVEYKDYAMYPVDEPGLNDGLVDRYLDNAKLTRKADPKVLMYTDPVERITIEEIEEMLPYVDIWCPNRNGLLLNTGADKFQLMKDSGAQLWNYECEGNAKHQSPLGYYRGQAWLAWHHGLTGIGFWSYCTSGADPWYRPSDTLDYLLTYQGEGVVASKRWEAIRDGAEDYAMLTALRETVAIAKKNGRTPKAVTEAEILLASGASSIAQFCGLDDDGTVPGKGGLPGVRKIADTRYGEIQQMREEIARLMTVLENK